MTERGKELQKKKDELDKKINSPVANEFMKQQFREELVGIESELSAEKAQSEENLKMTRDRLEATEKQIGDAEKERIELEKKSKYAEAELKGIEVEKKTYLSPEKERLIAIKGGQDVKKDDRGNTTQRAVESTYKQRASALADEYENISNARSRIAALVGGPSTLAVPFTPKTKADRSEIARKMRDKAKAKKTPKQIFDDFLKETEEKPAEQAKEESPEAPKEEGQEKPTT